MNSELYMHRATSREPTNPHSLIGCGLFAALWVLLLATALTGAAARWLWTH